MALIPCPECKTEVSEQASNCPKCGYPLRNAATTAAGTGLPPDSGFGQLYANLWFHPRKTIRLILDKKPGYAVWGIVFLYYGLVSLNPNDAFFMSGWVKLPAAIPLGILVFTLIGLASFWVGAWLYWRVGKMFGGKGDFRDVYTANAWGLVPLCAAEFLAMVKLAHYWAFMGSESSIAYQAFQASTGATHSSVVLGIAQGILGLWGFVLLVGMLAEAHRFSAIKAFFVFVVAAIPFGLVAFFLMSAFPEGFEHLSQLK